MGKCILCASTFLSFLSIPLYAASVYIHGATDDAYINNHSAHNTTNYTTGYYGQVLSLANTNTAGDGVHDLVIKFDTSAYLGQTAQSATINLYRRQPLWTNQSDFYFRNVDISYFNVSWSESSITWVNAPSSTFVKRLNIGNSESYVNCWVQIDITDIANYWLSGDVANNGIRIHADYIYRSWWNFQQTEDGTNMPFLMLTFEDQQDPEPVPVPEPATILLAGLSAAGLLRRKLSIS